jgi:F-type H+-transporting ATPase subunit b
MSNSLLSSVFIIIGAESEGGLFDFNATLPLMAVQIVVLSLLLNFIFYKPLTASGCQDEQGRRRIKRKVSRIFRLHEKGP